MSVPRVTRAGRAALGSGHAASCSAWNKNSEPSHGVLGDAKVIQDPLCAWVCAGKDRRAGLEEGPEWRVQPGTMTSPDWPRSTQKGPQPSRGRSLEAAKPEARFGELDAMCWPERKRTHRGPEAAATEAHIYDMVLCP